MDDFYRDMLGNPKHKTIVWHRLAVHLNNKEKALTRKLIDTGEQLAKENECLSVRLDTF